MTSTRPALPAFLKSAVKRASAKGDAQARKLHKRLVEAERVREAEKMAKMLRLQKKRAGRLT